MDGVLHTKQAPPIEEGRGKGKAIAKEIRKGL